MHRPGRQEGRAAPHLVVVKRRSSGELCKPTHANPNPQTGEKSRLSVTGPLGTSGSYPPEVPIGDLRAGILQSSGNM